ncbi:MAG: asparagine synthase (glutamine-hydrolyzing) [Methanobacterium sp.]|nr:asparagine synthase (glutamine-hydrolyzing) [Methanobacterium sp.]
MCAIAGIQGENISFKLQQMLITLKHRGMDGSGFFVDGMLSYGEVENLNIPQGNLAMGHNLLSIVGGEEVQPLKNDKMVLVCNGEIYNHLKLKRDLDYDFQSESDCEVIMALMEKYNHLPFQEALVNSMKCLDGDYAFAIYNGEDLAVLRDPVGVKPLYFGIDKKNLSAFASEKKALWEIGLKDVFNLPPGYMLYNWKMIELNYGLKTVLDKKLDIKLKSNSINRNMNHIHNNGLNNILKGKLKTSLISSVEKRLEGLTEVGIMFSGGIDSTLLAFLTDDLGMETILYSVGHKDSADLKFAQKTADHMGLPLKIKKINQEDVRKYLPLVLESIEEFNIMKLGVGMPGYISSKMAHEDGIKVMLSGQGADELFAGYHRYLKLYQEHGQDADKYILDDIFNLYQVNLERDDKVTMANQVELRVPYLDLDVINIAINIPMKYKINSENDPQRKCILREIAQELGVLEENVKRPKKAAQYGSGIDKMLRRVLKDDEYFKTLNPRYDFIKS